jgi:hypothetical protein
VVTPKGSTHAEPSSVPSLAAAEHARVILGGGYVFAEAEPAATPASVAAMLIAAATVSSALVIRRTLFLLWSPRLVFPLKWC